MSSEVSRHEKLTPITFLPSRELSEGEMAKLVEFTGKLGLSQKTKAEVKPPTNKELVEEYLKNNMPKSSQDYIDKFHLWAIGDELGIDRRHTTPVFTQLAFPVKNNSPLRSRDPIDPASIGLVVADREDLGMPSFPVNSPPVGTNYTYAHTREIKNPKERRKYVNNRVVQIAGMAAVYDSYDVSEFMTPSAISTLEILTPRLKEFS